MDSSDDIEITAPRVSQSDFDWKVKRLNTEYPFFVKTMFGFVEQPKQELFGQCVFDHRHTLGCFSRQSGKSFGAAGIHCKWLWLGDHGQKCLIGVYAPSFEQTYTIMFRQIVDLIESQPIIAEEVIDINRSRAEIMMNDGSNLRCFTADPAAKLRGHRKTHFHLDEAGDISGDKRSSEILPSGAAGTRWIGGKIETNIKSKIMETGTTTPGSDPHWYNNALNAKILNTMDDIKTLRDDEIAIVYQPWQESTTISIEAVEKAQRDMTESQFEMEYECKWNLSTGIAFDWSLIDAACTQELRQFTRKKNGWYVGGIDLGKNKDHTVITIFEWKAPAYDMVYHYEFDLNLQWHEILNGIRTVLKQWKPYLTYFDATGPSGNDLYHRLFSEGDYNENHLGRVDGFEFDPKTKLDLVYNGQRILERGYVRMWDERKLIHQFRIIPEDRNKAGKPVFDKPKGEKDDRVYSVLLALKAGQDAFGDTGERTKDRISFNQPPKSDFWSVIEDIPAASRAVDSGIAVGSGAIKSIFNDKDLWEGI